MKTKQRGFIVPLLIVIIALLLAGGAYVYTQQKQANQPVTGNSTAQTTSTTQTSNSQTADWKTYTNIRYGFEIKYPQRYTIIEDDKDPGHIFIGGVIYNYMISIENNVSLEELVSSRKKSIEDLAGSFVVPLDLKITWKDTIISGKKAIEMSHEPIAGGYDGIVHETFVVNNNVGVILTNYSPDKEYYQILSTFKFLP